MGQHVLSAVDTDISDGILALAPHEDGDIDSGRVNGVLERNVGVVRLIVRMRVEVGVEHEETKAHGSSDRQRYRKDAVHVIRDRRRSLPTPGTAAGSVTGWKM